MLPTTHGSGSKYKPASTIFGPALKMTKPSVLWLKNETSYVGGQTDRHGLTNLRSRPTTSCSLSAIASLHTTPIVVSVAAKSAARAWSPELDLRIHSLYAAGAFVSVRFMAAVFGTSSGVPGKRVISPVDQPEHSPSPIAWSRWRRFLLMHSRLHI